MPDYVIELCHNKSGDNIFKASFSTGLPTAKPNRDSKATAGPYEQDEQALMQIQ